MVFYRWIIPDYIAWITTKGLWIANDTRGNIILICPAWKVKLLSSILVTVFLLPTRLFYHYFFDAWISHLKTTAILFTIRFHALISHLCLQQFCLYVYVCMYVCMYVLIQRDVLRGVPFPCGSIWSRREREKGSSVPPSTRGRESGLQEDKE